jgi:multiple sugar transport system permease protein
VWMDYKCSILLSISLTPKLQHLPVNRPHSRGSRPRSPRWNITENLAGYLFMAPTILVLGTFVVLPILYAVFLSLQKVELLGGIKYEFIGFRNFTRLVEDELVWIALRNTAEYVAIVIPTQTVLALVLAVTLNSGIRGKNWWRILYFLPKAWV